MSSLVYIGHVENVKRQTDRRTYTPVKCDQKSSLEISFNVSLKEKQIKANFINGSQHKTKRRAKSVIGKKPVYFRI